MSKFPVLCSVLALGALIAFDQPGLHAADSAAKIPALKAPAPFNTPQADAILAAIRIFPKTNPWHEDISHLKVRANSQQLIDSVGAKTHLAYNQDMCFIIVPPTQKLQAVKLVDYPDESEPGPYPVPDNATIEGWPVDDANLDHIQRVGSGDRHLIILDPWNGRLIEFWQARRSDAGWQASNAAVFDLTSNHLRTEGWTSADAAGLPILPAVVRYDECQRGLIDHALRFTIKRSRKAHLYPATHDAGHTNDPNVPAMGERFRLKAGVDISGFPPHARAVAQALKTYGMLVADNGGDWRISVAPDSRIQGLDALHALSGGDFEVVETTGPNEGPRAAGK